MHTIENVVDEDMCVGCGACSVVSGGKVPVTIGRFGSYKADFSTVDAETRKLAGKVCPFSDESRNENSIAASVFPSTLPHLDVLGKFKGVYAGRLADDDLLEGSSSGGLTSWVARKLLEKELVDGVIHVGTSSEATAELFSYQVSYSAGELLGNRKSAYYSTSFAEAVQSIRGDGRRYAFTGVPCFVRAARLICEEDEVLASQILYFLGLVCGHLKSDAFAKSLAWQTGVVPRELESVDFRIKAPGRASKDYDFGARGSAAKELLTKPTQALVGGNWGHGMFQLNACNYCDDIFAETADVAFGDAWLPEYTNESKGTNVLVTRHPVIDEIVQFSRDNGELCLEDLLPERAIASQGGNYRHRRLGLSVRLHDDISKGLSVPNKRVAPTDKAVTRRRRSLIRIRRAMSAASHHAFEQAVKQDDLNVFLTQMRPWLRRYEKAERDGVFRRQARALIRRARRIRERILR